jgi:hypothetical protein
VNRRGGHHDICAGGRLCAWQCGHVSHDLEAASAAYATALRRVTDALAEVSAARAAVPGARARLAVEIVAAHRSGIRVADIARITSYGREQVRRILRAGGVGPDES